MEVRKRISKRWVLTATWRPEDENNPAADSQASDLVLQWEKRF